MLSAKIQLSPPASRNIRTIQKHFLSTQTHACTQSVYALCHCALTNSKTAHLKAFHARPRRIVRFMCSQWCTCEHFRFTHVLFPLPLLSIAFGIQRVDKSPSHSFDLPKIAGPCFSTAAGAKMSLCSYPHKSTTNSASLLVALRTPIVRGSCRVRRMGIRG